MPVGAAAVGLLGWVATPGFQLTSVGGDTNAALSWNCPRVLAGGVNSVPVRHLMPILSNAALVTNVSFHGWN